MIQPVQVMYGGAHLFRAGTFAKLGAMARRALEVHAPDAATLAAALSLPDSIAEEVHARVTEKLMREPVEDFRVDFEDGFGVRSNEDEDAAAIAAAEQTNAATLPRFFGIRIKALSGATKVSGATEARALRTLELFMRGLGGKIPPNFLVTLPKIVEPQEVRTLVRALKPFPSVRIELMIETPQALLAIPKLVEAAEGRAIAAHFGAYDYTSSLGITSASQGLRHPACDFARSMMQVQLASTDVWLCDGATNLLPLQSERAAIHRAWKLHYENVRHALDAGFYQGWDLHPAQLPARFAAVFAFFLEGRAAAAERLENFAEQAHRATQVGGVFDDAATVRGLVNFFERAVSCGALHPDELPPCFTSLALR